MTSRLSRSTGWTCIALAKGGRLLRQRQALHPQAPAALGLRLLARGGEA